MRIVVTGGAGFVGLQVSRMLVDRGHEVTVFSRTPSEKRLGDLNGRVSAVAGDVGNFSHVLDLVKAAKPEVIYHLGAMLSVPSDADPAAAIQTNAMGTFYVLEAARLFDVRQVVFSSSVATYGSGLGKGDVDDWSLQRPTLFYGATKVFGEHMGLVYKRKYGLDFRGIRYPSVVGPGVATPGVAQYTSKVIEAAMAGKTFAIWVEPDSKVALMSLKDAARATVELAEAPVDAIKTVNYLVDGAKPTPTAGEIAEKVRARFQGAGITFEPDPVIAPIMRRQHELNDSAARTEWGWQPRQDYDAIIDDFVSDS